MTSDCDHREGRYLYCIVNDGKETDFGQMGIDDNLVYTVPFNDIGAVVHRCEAKPYLTGEKKRAEEWILAHQYVIDLASKESGTVIPLTFDTILKGGDEMVREWLGEAYNQLKALLQNLQGKAEYEVQVFLDEDFIEKAVGENEEIQSLRKEMRKKSGGAAYLLGKKLQNRLETERRKFTDEHAKCFCDEIKPLVDDVRLRSLDKRAHAKWEGRQMILNLTCLVHDAYVRRLGHVLGHVSRKEGFAVRFTGPWPPYSFVGEIGNRRAK